MFSAVRVTINSLQYLACALALCASQSAQAQVQFDSGSARPVNPGGAAQKVAPNATPRKRSKLRLVTCRDGSRHTAGFCRRHGGVT
ncbi:MAG: hypothetical protein JWP36_2688 [Paucimonas sp.]|jgi:hypothetical protein|nr:hypothetical protein [Paucimonas sp.]